MLRRSTKIQLIIFVIITLLGVSYVSAEYVGLTNGIFGPSGCTVTADFPDSGGIFTDAEVTYRGVTVGRVGQLHLLPNGVRVDLKIKNCNNPRIPASAIAQVSDRSVIGEQYVNLIPPNGDGPYLRKGSNIAMAGNKIPLPPQALLQSLDTFVHSVNTQNLSTLVNELGQAFNDQGPALSALLDSSNLLLNAAQSNLPDTLALIKNSDQTLQTQLDSSADIATWAHNLNLLSQQLKASNGDISHLFSPGSTDLATIGTFVTDNRTDLGVTLSNLASTGQLLVRRIDGVEELFELYPSLAAGTYTSLRSDGVGLLGFVVNSPNPVDCGAIKATQPRQGYNTVIRAPSDNRPIPPNTAAHCALPASSGQDVRGAQNAPGGDPISTAGGNVAYPRVDTASTIRVGSTDGSAALLGDRSWEAMLTDGLH
jgi:phospholipid/cholesterol/gamma-HCH transport system substrate-binding protein